MVVRMLLLITFHQHGIFVQNNCAVMQRKMSRLGDVNNAEGTHILLINVTPLTMKMGISFIDSASALDQKDQE